MASNGICDKVAIVGMGCTAFGEHWDKSTDDLLVEAATAAYKSAGVDPDRVDAYWLGTMGQLSGKKSFIEILRSVSFDLFLIMFCCNMSEWSFLYLSRISS